MSHCPGTRDNAHDCSSSQISADGTILVQGGVPRINIPVTLKIPNRSSRIVCNSPRWNQIEQVGGAPGVGELEAAPLLLPEKPLRNNNSSVI